MDKKDVSKNSPRYNITYQKAPIWLLDLEKDLPKDKILSFWDDLKLKKSDQIHASNISVEQIKLFEMSGMTYRHMLVDTFLGTKLEVITVGSGIPILQINPVMTAPVSIFQMEEWSKQNQFILINPPGCGLSELTEDLSFNALCDMYIDVLNKLGITKLVHVVGISWGGMFAQAFACTYPDRLATVTISGSMCMARGGAITKDEALVNLRADFEQIPEGIEYYQYLQKGGGINFNALKAYTKETGNEHNKDYITMDYLSRIHIPVLVIAGSKDSVVDKEESLLLQRMIPNARYYEIEGAGHCPFLTHHEEFNRVVLQFIIEKESLLNSDWR